MLYERLFKMFQKYFLKNERKEKIRIITFVIGKRERINNIIPKG